MATFMVERYLPGVSAGQAAAGELLAEQLAMRLRTEGGTVRHLRSLFVPQDEQCFVLFQATSAHALAETLERLGIGYERIAESKAGVQAPIIPGRVGQTPSTRIRADQVTSTCTPTTSQVRAREDSHEHPA